MRIEDPYIAYCFDEAVAHLGHTIEHELSLIKAKKPELEQSLKTRRLYELLGRTPPGGTFASPIATR